MEGTIHVYDPKRRLPLFQYSPPNGTSHDAQPPIKHILLFVGGMYDNFGSTSYVNDLAAVLSPPWCLVHVQLSSAIRQFGFSDLHKDIENISTAITYIRTSVFSPETSVVLMGHSTGCQDVLLYLTSPIINTGSSTSSKDTSIPRPKVQGAILQAPVSDRDMIQHTISTNSYLKDKFDSCLSLVSSTSASDHTNHFLPLDMTTSFYGPAPITMSRFLSLASPESPTNPGLDDIFSHDLTDSTLQTTFGHIGSAGVLDTPHATIESSSNNSAAPDSKPSVLILLSGNDEYYPPPFHSDNTISNLGARFKAAIEHAGLALTDPSSSVLPGAKHDLSGESLPARRTRLVKMRKAVLSYLDRSVGDVPKAAWDAVKKVEVEIEREERNKGEDFARGIMEGLKL